MIAAPVKDLPCARLTYDAEHLTGLDGKADIVDRGQGAVSARKLDPQIFHPQ